MDGNWLIAVRARSTGSDPTAPPVAIGTSLFAQVVGIAVRAGVDDRRAGHGFGNHGSGVDLSPGPVGGIAWSTTAGRLDR